MPRRYVVKMPPVCGASLGEYVVVTCPKCGKKTYGVTRQKGKRCPVCWHQFPMPDTANAQRFKTPEAACRFIQAEEAKRTGRLDFTPVTSGFRPASCAPVIPRTSKVVAEAVTLDAQFATWVKQYFSTATDNRTVGIPPIVLIAEATKAGFSGADMLVYNAIAAGILSRPKSYLVCLCKLGT